MPAPRKILTSRTKKVPPPELLVTVTVVLASSRQVVLTRRPYDEDNENDERLWAPVQGHLLPAPGSGANESELDAATRLVDDQTRILLAPDKLVPAGAIDVSFSAGSTLTNHRLKIYAVHLPWQFSRQRIFPFPHTAWFSLNELPVDEMSPLGNYVTTLVANGYSLHGAVKLDAIGSSFKYFHVMSDLLNIDPSPEP